jgi:hypothetical protein
LFTAAVEPRTGRERLEERSGDDVHLMDWMQDSSADHGYTDNGAR